MIYRRLASCFVASAVFLSACAHSSSSSRIHKTVGMDGEIVEAEGTAPYHADDIPGSKAAALAAAQRAAVEQVVGVYVSARTKVDKAVAIEQNILAKTDGYVKKYEIISEGASGEWYKIRIRALVSTKTLRDDLTNLGLLKQPSVGYPRVAILLQEFVGEVPSTDGTAARTLTQLLLDQGFKVVDLPANVHSSDDGVEAAKAIKHQTADIVLSGIARAQSLGYGKDFGGMASYRATISLRVIETGTGDVISTLSEVASGLEATKIIAAQKSLENAAKAVELQLKTLPDKLSQNAHVEVTIMGETSFENLGRVQKLLAQEPGVKDVFLRSFTQETGVAVYDVLVDQISPQEVADKTVKIGGGAWYVYHVEGRAVSISASQAGR